jgi:DNA-binding NtrC family response regulator
MIRAGTFREDLYYRLNTIEIRIPPLAQRTDDILPLAHALLAPGRQLSADAKAALRAHSWPGNVRELKNALQRASLLATGDAITAADLALTAPPPPEMRDELDRETIEAALVRAGGVVSQAAAELGLSRQALYRRMEKLSIPRE